LSTTALCQPAVAEDASEFRFVTVIVVTVPYAFLREAIG
jgi:hypothetical protein